MSNKEYVVIVGAGRLGRVLAGRLSASGHPVVVLDQSEEALGRLPVEFSGFQVRGDAGELPTLEKARFAEADVVFAATDSDNLNFMIVQAATIHFDVPHAVARVADPALQDFCERLGVDTINPNLLAADVFLDRLSKQEGS